MRHLAALLPVLGALLAPSAALNLADTACGERQVTPGARTRVKGGQEAYRGQFPWAASVQHRGAHFCMGAVLSRRHVLTAAHCLGGRPVGQFTVMVGGHNLTASGAAEPGRRALPVAERVIHPGYVEGRFDDDIALLRLAEPLAWGDYVQPVCLPPAAADAKHFTGMRGLMAGWGYLDEWRSGGQRSDTLQWTALPLLSPPTCQQWFTEAGKAVTVKTGKVCAGYREGGRDSCQADSGAALTVRVGGQFQVAGVVSAGIGCGRPGLPGLYTDVTHYGKWIVEHVQAAETPVVGGGQPAGQSRPTASASNIELSSTEPES